MGDTAADVRWPENLVSNSCQGSSYHPDDHSNLLRQRRQSVAWSTSSDWIEFSVRTGSTQPEDDNYQDSCYDRESDGDGFAFDEDLSLMNVPQTSLSAESAQSSQESIYLVPAKKSTQASPAARFNGRSTQEMMPNEVELQREPQKTLTETSQTHSRELLDDPTYETMSPPSRLDFQQSPSSSTLVPRNMSLPQCRRPPLPPKPAQIETTNPQSKPQLSLFPDIQGKAQQFQSEATSKEYRPLLPPKPKQYMNPLPQNKENHASMPPPRPPKPKQENHHALSYEGTEKTLRPLLPPKPATETDRQHLNPVQRIDHHKNLSPSNVSPPNSIQINYSHLHPEPGDDHQPMSELRNTHQQKATSRNDKQQNLAQRNGRQRSPPWRYHQQQDLALRNDNQPNLRAINDHQLNQAARNDNQPSHTARNEHQPNHRVRNEPQPKLRPRDDSPQTPAPRIEQRRNRALQNNPAVLPRIPTATQLSGSVSQHRNQATPTVSTSSEGTESNSSYAPQSLSSFNNSSTQRLQGRKRRPHCLLNKRNLLIASSISALMSVAAISFLLCIQLNIFSFTWRDRTFREGTYKTCVKCMSLIHDLSTDLFNPEFQDLITEAKDGETFCCAINSRQMSSLLKLILRKQEYQPSPSELSASSVVPSAHVQLFSGKSNSNFIGQGHTVLTVSKVPTLTQHNQSVTIQKYGLKIAISGYYYVYSSICFNVEHKQCQTGKFKHLEHTIFLVRPTNNADNGFLAKTAYSCCTDCRSGDKQSNFAGGVFKLLEGDQVATSVTNADVVLFDDSSYLGAVKLGS